MIDSLLLTRDYLRITFREIIQFRANFAAGVIGLALSSLFQLLGAVAVISHFGEAAGWTVGQVTFMFGLWRIQYGLMLILAPVWGLEYLIREGILDRLLVRPRPVLLQLPGLRFSTSGVGQILMGAAMAIGGAVVADVNWSVWTLPWLVVITVSGTVIQVAIWVGISSLNFYHVQVGAAIRQIDRTSWQINLFPLSVYSVAMQAVLTFVLPWGFMVFYPAHAVFGKESDFAGTAIIYLAPAVAMIISLLSGLVWRRGLNHYQGMGGG